MYDLNKTQKITILVEGMDKLIKYLNKIGVDEALHKAGAKDGDTVKLCDFEFEYFE